MATTLTRHRRRTGTPDLVKPIFRLLTSVRFAVGLIGCLSVVALAGVLIPQIPEAMRGNDAAVNAWVDSKRGTYGPATDVMYRMGLFSVFQAKWFLFALAFLVLSVGVCTFNRWAPTFRNVFNPPRRVPESFFGNAHNRTVLAPVTPEAAVDALRSLRFKVEREDRDGATYLFADRYPWVQLATFISHLALVLFIAGGLVTRLTGFSTTAFAGEGTTIPVFPVKAPNQLQVRIDDAVGVYGDRGNPLDFRTFITIFKNGEEVKSGAMTVNDPLKYGGYRFHQIAFLADGVELRVRDVATNNTLMRETIPLEQTTAAPVVVVRDAAGRTLFDDTVAPTDFLKLASGTLVQVPQGPVLWIGLTTRGNDWQLVAYDPELGASAAQRIDVGASATLGQVSVEFPRVASLPAARGVGMPGGQGEVVAQLIRDSDGRPILQLAGEGRPAISLAEGEPVTVGGLEYTFEGMRDFAGIAVRRDAGAWFIWAATGMLLGGLAITFYVPRRRLWLKVTRTETNIAALAEKSGGFAGDMRTLARRMQVEVPPELQEER